jgi:hypothetical protein
MSTTTPAAPAADGDLREVEGNERLTAWAGAALLAGFSAELLTLLNVHWYMRFHILIGVALFAPLAVKLASTGYRFFRYYTNDPAYVRKGPPQIALRVLAPLLIANTLVVLLSGLWLSLTHRLHFQMGEIHELGTWTWIGLAVAHVLAYLLPTAKGVLADLMRRETTTAAALRRAGVVAASGVIGLGLGAVAVSFLYEGR